MINSKFWLSIGYWQAICNCIGMILINSDMVIKAGSGIDQTAAEKAAQIAQGVEGGKLVKKIRFLRFS